MRELIGIGAHSSGGGGGTYWQEGANSNHYGILSEY